MDADGDLPARGGAMVVAPDQRGYGRTIGWDDAYELRDHKIHVSGSIDLASVRDQSILLHEIVHHLQISNAIKLPCRSAYDAQAYRLQTEWLKEQGIPNGYTITMKEGQIEDLEECAW